MDHECSSANGIRAVIKADHGIENLRVHDAVGVHQLIRHVTRMRAIGREKPVLRSSRIEMAASRAKMRHAITGTRLVNMESDPLSGGEAFDFNVDENACRGLDQACFAIRGAVHINESGSCSAVGKSRNTREKQAN